MVRCEDRQPPAASISPWFSDAGQLFTLHRPQGGLPPTGGGGWATVKGLQLRVGRAMPVAVGCLAGWLAGRAVATAVLHLPLGSRRGVGHLEGCHGVSVGARCCALHVAKGLPRAYALPASPTVPLQMPPGEVVCCKRHYGCGDHGNHHPMGSAQGRDQSLQYRCAPSNSVSGFCGWVTNTAHCGRTCCVCCMHLLCTFVGGIAAWPMPPLDWCCLYGSARCMRASMRLPCQRASTYDALHMHMV